MNVENTLGDIMAAHNHPLGDIIMNLIHERKKISLLLTGSGLEIFEGSAQAWRLNNFQSCLFSKSAFSGHRRNHII